MGRLVLRIHQCSLAAGHHSAPVHVLGHIGYSVVPWKQRRGYATKALKVIVREIIDERLITPFVELTTDIDNVASQHVIERNGHVMVERFEKPTSHGGGELFRFRISTVADGTPGDPT